MYCEACHRYWQGFQAIFITIFNVEMIFKKTTSFCWWKLFDAYDDQIIVLPSLRTKLTEGQSSHCEMSLFQGMTFDFLLQTPEDLKKLNTIVDVTQELHYVMDAITLTRQRLEGRCPLIGFAGAPVSVYSLNLTGTLFFFLTWKFHSP